MSCYNPAGKCFDLWQVRAAVSGVIQFPGLLVKIWEPNSLESARHLHPPHLSRSRSGAGGFSTLDVFVQAFNQNQGNANLLTQCIHFLEVFTAIGPRLGSFLSFVYARLSALARAPPPSLHGWVRGEPSVTPLILSSTTALSEHLRSDVGAQAALGENADSALISKNRRETPRLERLQRRRHGTSAMLKSGVSVMSAMPSRPFRSLNMDMLGRRG